MGRIVHIALKCNDKETFEKSTTFYEKVFGIYPTKTDHARGHLSRHMTDGNIDLALMVYDSENEKEAKLAGAGARIHHIGIEVTDRPSMIKKIEDNGGKIFSDRAEGALKYFAPDGTLGEIVGVGRYPKKDNSKKARIVHVAMKVADLEKSTRFYENVFGFKQLETVKNHGHVSRHMTDGETDIALMVYDSEDAPEAQLAGKGPGIHHWGLEVPDRAVAAEQIKANGGEILSKPDAKALKFRGPDGNIGEIVGPGGFEEYKKSA
ncbi:MAG TPA: VOC family protein [Xanthobacteraceae bacterium]|nr:VOC family protein [Xanthobacteraceae bacterium]